MALTRWLSAYGGPASRTSGGSLALRVRHRSPAALPRLSVRPFQAPHLSRLARSVRPVRRTHRASRQGTPCRKRFASLGIPLPRKGVAVVQAGLSVSRYARPARRSECPLIVTRPRSIPPPSARAFGLVAAGSTAAPYGTPAFGGFAPQCRRARPVPSQEPLPSGCAVALRAPARRCSSIPNASRIPPARPVHPVRCTRRATADNTKRKRCASPGRPLPRKGVAVVQAGLSVSHYVRPTRRFSRRSSSPCTLRKASARQVPLLVGSTASREPPARSVRPVRRTHRAHRRGIQQGVRCAHPHEERAGRPDLTPFPPSVSPLWTPPVPAPPFQTRIRQRGATAGGTGAAADHGAAEHTAGSLSPRSRAPPPFGWAGTLQRLAPHCATAPEGRAPRWGGVALVPHSHTHSSRKRCAGLTVPPLRLMPPGGGRRVGLLGAPAHARERRRKLRKGDTPLPPRARNLTAGRHHHGRCH